MCGISTEFFFFKSVLGSSNEQEARNSLFKLKINVWLENQNVCLTHAGRKFCVIAERLSYKETIISQTLY